MCSAVELRPHILEIARGKGRRGGGRQDSPCPEHARAGDRGAGPRGAAGDGRRPGPGGGADGGDARGGGDGPPPHAAPAAAPRAAPRRGRQASARARDGEEGGLACSAGVGRVGE